MMDLGIKGRWALVGGASKGLGLGCAQALAAEGVNVLMVARGQEVLEASATKIRANYAINSAANGENTPQIITVAADITTPQGREKIFAVRQEFDILITNAGGPPPGDFRQWGREEWLSAIDANMLTPIELIKAVVDGMAQRGFGRIVNITSSAVKSPIDTLGLSNGARSGLTGFIAGLARSPLANQGVTINNLLPGSFDTERIQRNFEIQAAKTGKTAQELRASRIQGLTNKRFGTYQEFGQYCAFVCSMQAAYINGQNLLIDGGSYSGTF